MKPFVISCFLCVLWISAVQARTNCRCYVSPDRQLRAEVKNIQAQGEVMPESVVSIYDAHGNLLRQKSYVSPDHEHGQGVVQLRWSADSQYCVWSLTSSGGHSPWHFPTDCYARHCSAIVNIDAQMDVALTQAHFKLQASHQLQTKRLIPHPQGEPEYVKWILDLDDLKCE